jgi:hypothetical protein
MGKKATIVTLNLAGSLFVCMQSAESPTSELPVMVESSTRSLQRNTAYHRAVVAVALLPAAS